MCVILRRFQAVAENAAAAMPFVSRGVTEARSDAGGLGIRSTGRFHAPGNLDVHRRRRTASMFL